MLLSHGRKQTTQTSPYKVNISASRRGDINVKSSTVSCSRAMTWHHIDRITATRCALQILSNGNRTRHFFIFVVFFFTKMFLYLIEVAVVITPHGFRPDTTHAVLLARPTPTSSRKRHHWLQQRHNSTRLQQRSS